jgi:hypothetical protein
VSARPPSEQELTAACDLYHAWHEVVKAGNQRAADFGRMASDRGINEWGAYWSPSESLWWGNEPGSLSATGLSAHADNAHFGWLVPQEPTDALLVVATAEVSLPPTGPTPGDSRADKTPFAPVMGDRRGVPRHRADELHGLVPWLRELDAEQMAKRESVPGCESHGFNVRAIHVMDEDDHDAWFCYEVYPLGDARRQNILGVVEVLEQPLVFVPPGGPPPCP